MLESLAIMPFVFLATALFLCPCYFLERLFIRADKLAKRKAEREKRKAERRELRKKEYENEIAIALALADNCIKRS